MIFEHGESSFEVPNEMIKELNKGVEQDLNDIVRTLDRICFKIGSDNAKTLVRIVNENWKIIK